jgi:outer membrane protein
MKQLMRHVIIILILITADPAFSQVSDSGRKWNILECFQYARDHNIQVNTLRLNELTALQNLSAAQGVKIPSLSASVGNTFNNANNSSGTGGLINQLTSS